MKKIYFAASLLVSVATFAQSVSFENITIGSSESYWDGSDLSGTSNGSGQLSTNFSESYFTFNNVYDTSWGVAYGYWADGWSFSNQTMDTMTNLNGQHSSYAGGSYNGTQYAIGQQNSRIYRTGTNAFESIKITNTNYSAHSMLNGDAFAKQFGGTTGDDPDWFLLTIRAYNDIDMKYDSVQVYLADYRFTNNAQDYIVKNWLTVDISSLAMADYLEFYMTSSDVGTYGMNTPSFFAVDEMTYTTDAGIEENEAMVSIYPNPTTEVLNIDNFDQFNRYEVITIDGSMIVNKTLNSNRILVNDLPTGNYFIRLIGEKVVTQPFIKR